MSLSSFLLCLLLSLFSNLLAEWFLASDLQRPLRTLTGAARLCRIVRWVACAAGLLVAGAAGVAPVRLALLALFSVSAATDLETQYLPPDWFVYGAVAAGIFGGLALNGAAGLRDAVVAQAVCFVLMVFGVLLAGIADSGDIKLLMQYGAACGSLGAVGVGMGTEFLVRIAVLVVALVMFLASGQTLPEALRRTAVLRLAHGPVAWVGLLTALCWAGVRS